MEKYEIAKTMEITDVPELTRDIVFKWMSDIHRRPNYIMTVNQLKMLQELEIFQQYFRHIHRNVSYCVQFSYNGVLYGPLDDIPVGELDPDVADDSEPGNISISAGGSKPLELSDDEDDEDDHNADDHADDHEADPDFEP